MSELLSFSFPPHTIHQGDVIDGLAAVPDQSVDLIFVDPPYNIGKKFGASHDRWPSEQAYLDWCYSWIDRCIQKLTAQGSMYLMASTQTMPWLDLYLRERMEILSRIVWSYDSSGVQARRYYGSLYEPILFAVKDKRNYVFNADAIAVEAPTGAKRRLIDYRKHPPEVYASTKVPGNVWSFPRVRYRMPEYQQHPSQKPEALLERILLASSHPGDTVLDPFAGSFTTAVVAQRLGRASIGIEREPAYVEAGRRRLMAAIGSAPCTDAPLPATIGRPRAIPGGTAAAPAANDERKDGYGSGARPGT